MEIKVEIKISGVAKYKLQKNTYQPISNQKVFTSLDDVDKNTSIDCVDSNLPLLLLLWLLSFYFCPTYILGWVSK